MHRLKQRWLHPSPKPTSSQIVPILPRESKAGVDDGPLPARPLPPPLLPEEENNEIDVDVDVKIVPALGGLLRAASQECVFAPLIMGVSSDASQFTSSFQVKSMRVVSGSVIHLRHRRRAALKRKYEMAFIQLRETLRARHSLPMPAPEPRGMRRKDVGKWGKGKGEEEEDLDLELDLDQEEMQIRPSQVKRARTGRSLRDGTTVVETRREGEEEKEEEEEQMTPLRRGRPPGLVLRLPDGEEEQEEVVVDGSFEALDYTPLHTPRHTPLAQEAPPSPFKPPPHR